VISPVLHPGRLEGKIHCPVSTGDDSSGPLQGMSDDNPSDSSQDRHNPIATDVMIASTHPSLPSLQSRYEQAGEDNRPSPREQSGQSADIVGISADCKVMITNLPKTCSYNKIFSHFCRYVKIKKIKIWMDTNQQSANSILTSSHPYEAALLCSFKNVVIKGRKISIHPLDSRQQESSGQSTHSIIPVGQFRLKP